ncbi:hypothetical protein CHUAL_013728 [Chamberlinius hualienensis]
MVNNNGSNLPSDVRLVAHIKEVPPGNSFQVSKQACLLMKNRVAAIFGPQNRDSWMHVQSMCNYMEILHFDTRWNYNWEPITHNAINVYPYGPLLGKVYSSLIKLFKWQSFAVIYQDNEGLIKLNDLFQSQGKIALNIMMVKLPIEEQYHETLIKILEKGHNNIVIECHIDVIFKVLEQAQQIGMMTARHHYLITNLDLHTIDLQSFGYSGTTITSVRLVNSSRYEVKSTLELMEKTRRKPENPLLSDKHKNVAQMETEVALIFDAVDILAKGIKLLGKSSLGRPVLPTKETQFFDCESMGKWKQGDTLFNYLNTLTPFTGFSGTIGLSKGYRKHFELDIMELRSREAKWTLMPIGTWISSSNELNISSAWEYDTDDSIIIRNDTLKNKNVNISILLAKPYIMHKISSKSLKSNDQYEGYCIDLLNEIAKDLKFKYILHEVKGGNYSELIESLKNKTADLALGDITITLDRQAVVDFTTPFMNLGISILFRKPTKAGSNLLSFLSPFSRNVLILMGVTYLGVSAILFIIARLTPFEWDNPYPCIQEPEEIINSYTWRNSLWFTIGSLMQQGSDIAPKASSTRTLAAIWWFFTLIMVSSYTANLTAFLTVENLVTPIKDVKDLVAQNKIKYGCLMSGSTKSFFNKTQVVLYQQVFNNMQNDPSVYVNSNEEGEKRVVNSDYAYFMESTSSEYAVERNCNLTQIGGLLDAKGYGIAMQKNSSYRNELSQSVLRLQENGVLANLKIKWWKQKRGGGQCKPEEPDIKALGLDNVGGVFLVLVGGAFLALIVAVAEFWWAAKKQPTNQKKPLAKAMVDELKMAISCKGSKEVIKN